MGADAESALGGAGLPVIASVARLLVGGGRATGPIALVMARGVRRMAGRSTWRATWGCITRWPRSL